VSFLLLLSLAAPLQSLEQSRLTVLERGAGWQLLFDGETTSGWRGYGRVGFPDEGWAVEDGCLHLRAAGGGGDLVSEATFEDFELELEWKIAAGGNSGVKYRVLERAGQGAIGPEFQVLGPEAREAADALHATGSLYAVFPAQGAPLPVEAGFNRARIVVHSGRVEHWLNGRLAVQALVGSDEWEARRKQSKFAGVGDFGTERGHVLFQDHGDEVWFRDVRIRDLSALAAREVALYDGASLAGWRMHGDARYVPEPGGILGESSSGAHSFLVTERKLGDFVLEVDVKAEKPGNAGIQVRSHARPDGSVHGCQIEIDPSPRAWSGGLYDEARRGWLQGLQENPAGRAAFRPGEWNRFRIECIGPWIRTWVNGVPVTDYFDAMDLSGFVGLQVHGGWNTRVRWHGMRLWDLGTRGWQSADPPAVGVFGSTRTVGGSTSSTRTAVADVLDGLTEFTARVLFRHGSGRPAVALHPEGRLWTPPIQRGLAPLYPHRAGGWTLNDEPFGISEGWRELTIFNYGSRVAVDLDGKRLAEIRDALPLVGAVLSIAVHDGPLEFARVELLGEAR